MADVDHTFTIRRFYDLVAAALPDTIELAMHSPLSFRGAALDIVASCDGWHVTILTDVFALERVLPHMRLSAMASTYASNIAHALIKEPHLGNYVHEGPPHGGPGAAA